MFDVQCQRKKNINLMSYNKCVCVNRIPIFTCMTICMTFLSLILNFVIGFLVSLGTCSLITWYKFSYTNCVRNGIHSCFSQELFLAFLLYWMYWTYQITITNTHCLKPRSRVRTVFSSIWKMIVHNCRGLRR